MWHVSRLFPCLLIACMGVAPAFGVTLYPVSDVNVHGTLLKPDGTPLTGSRAVQVQFYDAPTGGNPLGGLLTGTVTLSAEGLFNFPVSLPVEVLGASEVFYAIGIDSDDPADNDASDDVFPDRIRVYSVPFALKAEEAEQMEASGVGNRDIDNTELSALDNISGNIQSQIDNIDAYDNLSANSKIGSNSGQVAAGDHSHALDDLSGSVDDTQVSDALTVQGGTVNTDSFSAITDLDAESAIGSGQGQVAAGNHTHAFDDLSGSVSTDDYSAVADLTAEGKLDNNDDGDLLTRTQADARYQAAGAGGADFNEIGSGTNTTASMVIGTGASLSASGSGAITATAVTDNAVTPVDLNGLGGNGTSGQIIQTDGDGTFSYTSAGGPTKVLKSGDTVYTGTTLTSDEHLQFAAAANSVYFVEGVVLIEEENDALDGDAYMGLSVPAGAVFRGSTLHAFRGVNAGVSQMMDASSDATSSKHDMYVAPGVRPAVFTGAVYTGGTAGTVSFQFSQYDAPPPGSGLRVKAGSFLLVTKGN